MKILGIDGGIASIGWGVIETDVAEDRAKVPTGRILAAGVRTFEAPETDKKRTPKNQVRRLYRGQRRVVNRRRQRMNSLRELFVTHGLLANADKDALRSPGLDPWRLRADALDRSLAPDELAVVLGHIARHRGFRSNAKRDRGANAADETSKMKRAIETTRKPLLNHEWRTVGEMLAMDPEFKKRRRNRAGNFDRSVLRDDQQHEVVEIFKCQRRFAMLQATSDLEALFIEKAFSQRGMQSSEHMVGNCPFEPDERRAAKRSPSFERFRFLARLTSLRLTAGRTEVPLTEEQITLALAGFGKSLGMKFHALRTALDLDPNTRFSGVGRDEEKQRDVVARSGGASEGAYALRKVIVDRLGEMGWQSALAKAETLDRIAAVLTFREDVDDIRSGIAEAGGEPTIVDAIMAGLDAGAFTKFKGAGHISAKAARAMIPALARGLVYSDAAAEASYDHTARPATRVEDIGSPVARKALSEMLKQIATLDHELGPFDRIHVELARDVGKSIEERGKIERGINDRTADKNRARGELAQLLGLRDVSSEDLLRYELWKEQAGKSLYSDAAIPIYAVLATDNRVQVDHILPWSRFGDDSYINKTLCLWGENQEKAGRTPFEWFCAEKPAEDWDRLVARVEAAAIRGRKKRNLVLKNAQEVEEQFRSRNLNDTRYATRVLLDELKRRYPATEDGRLRVFSRPGELTSKLRRAWGIDRLKRGPDGKRLSDDRHHALDALVVAAITNSQLQRLTEAFKEAERLGSSRDFRGLPEPWPGFHEQAEATYRSIFVSRAEVHRARGKAHDATIKQVRDIDGAQVVFERKVIENLTEDDLDRIPAPEPYGKVADPAKLHAETVAALRAWVVAGKPKGADSLPRSPKGDIIRKVRVSTTAKVAVEVRGGTADRGDMTRIDVFRKPIATGARKGAMQYFLVPIYPHEVAEQERPPNRAVQSGSADKWPEMDETFEFMWSVYQMSLIELTKTDGESILGVIAHPCAAV